MFFKKYESQGISHYSYIFADGPYGVVIDPKRDCQDYIKDAEENGFRIKYVFETHRNEDYVIGSCELKHLCGAEVWHADKELDYKYGNPVNDGQEWNVGRLKVKAIHTPGHTNGSMSYLLHDADGIPWIIFSGDVLFAGDVGRVDLFGMDKAEEMAEKLYDSIFSKILPLGDELILCPAHGAGSVCGSEIAERVWTTIGLEKQNNVHLQYDSKEEFIKKVAKKQDRPPYFRKMEKLNIEGPPVFGYLPIPNGLYPGEFAKQKDKAQILDTRMELGFANAHISNSINIWKDGLASFAGWYLDYDNPILLLNENNDPKEVATILFRLGFDNVKGYLVDNMLTWHMSGNKSEKINTILVSDFCKLLDKNNDYKILDVRSDDELKDEGEIENAIHIHITEIPQRYKEISKKENVYIFCGSGLRSMLAAGFLKNNGYEKCSVILGGLLAWKSKKCPLKLMKN